jgi:hypothetical protein
MDPVFSDGPSCVIRPRSSPLCEFCEHLVLVEAGLGGERGVPEGPLARAASVELARVRWGRAGSLRF